MRLLDRIYRLFSYIREKIFGIPYVPFPDTDNDSVVCFDYENGIMYDKL